MQPKTLKLGTRGSALALAQSNWVADGIRAAHPDIDLQIVRIVTGGDRSQATNTPLSTYTEKGIFAKEIEAALLAHEIDLAVHSMKDLAADLPQGLIISAVPPREDVRDVFVGATLKDLPNGSRVGTGSARRRALLSEIRPDLQLVEIRGNIDTRIGKLAAGGYDAIVLASAGLTRLSRTDVIAEYLDPYVFVPDPGQGALAIEVHADNPFAVESVRVLNDLGAELCTRAERAFLRAHGGGCSTPVGAWARMTGTLAGVSNGTIAITGMSAIAGGRIVRATLSGDSGDPEELGSRLADLIAAS